ncbi:MAG: hypothetical protein FWH12_03090 [Treponema sp.]|nr:hypothetical protein [Treponema sp.]
MAEYIIGVDVGGTKSHLAIFTKEGKFVGLGEWRGLNHEGMPGSYGELQERFGDFLKDVLPRYGLTMEEVSYSVLGMAGADTIEQHEQISRVLTNLGFARHTLVNDAFLGVPAGSQTGVGICAINGTGCTSAGIDAQGSRRQLGGVGYVSNDMGGGSTMARFLVSAAYSDLFRKAPATSMTPKLLEYLGITNKHDFVERVYELNAARTFDRTACVKIVFEAADSGDQVARKFLREVAHNYAGGISTLVDEMDFPKDEALHIVLAGSVFVRGNNPHLIGPLKEYLEGFNPGQNFEYVLLDVPPVAGASVWALNILNGNTLHYEGVCQALRTIEEPS